MNLTLALRRQGLGGGLEILATDPRMPGGNSQQRDRRTIRPATSLFPIAKRMNADPHRPGELRLRQADESAKSGDVRA